MSENRTVHLSSTWARVEGPGGACVYVCAGTEPMFARCPIEGMEEATSFLEQYKINCRIDLRDKSCEADKMEEPLPFTSPMTYLISLPPLDRSEGEDNHIKAYLRNRYAITHAADLAKEYVYRGQVPLIHCRASADRTGTVIAKILLPALGVDVVAQDFEDASVHAGHPRAKEEILPLLTF